MLFAAQYGWILLKATQQRNVALDCHRWVVPTSMALAATEVYVIVKIAQEGFGWLLVLVLGTAGGLGALSAMWIHKRFIKKGN